jgi:oligosaccharyltransferase complex subunit alpha (ribophorin I)
MQMVLTYYRNVQYSTTVPLISAEISFHKTFMDTIGRTALTLNAVNVVDDLRDRELIVTYDYPFMAIFRKPLVIFAGFASLFVATWAIGNLDVSITGKKK